jgi:hypothetical protein
MRVFALFLLCCALAASAAAGIDQSWNEASDGGGATPAVAVFFGVVAAGLAVASGLKNGESLGSTAVAAVVCYSMGAMLGLLVSCVLN